MTTQKIYTRTGDQGKTRLVDGSCVEKFNPRVEAYGCVDELNSYLGLIRSMLKNDNDFNVLEKQLEVIQNELFNIGSILGCEKTETLSMLPIVEQKNVSRIEQEIDQMSEQLPPLKNFILPTGHVIASHLHVARTMCRRAERRSVEIESEEILFKNCLIYLNRLSDYLFIAARWVNITKQSPEVLWAKTST